MLIPSDGIVVHIHKKSVKKCYRWQLKSTSQNFLAEMSEWVNDWLWHMCVLNLKPGFLRVERDSLCRKQAEISWLNDELYMHLLLLQDILWRIFLFHQIWTFNLRDVSNYKTYAFQLDSFPTGDFHFDLVCLNMNLWKYPFMWVLFCEFEFCL